MPSTYRSCKRNRRARAQDEDGPGSFRFPRITTAARRLARLPCPSPQSGGFELHCEYPLWFKLPPCRKHFSRSRLSSLPPFQLQPSSPSLVLLLREPNQLSVPLEKATPEMLPRFTMECRERQGKRSLYWFLRFDGSPDFAFLPPFKPTSTNPFPPQNPNVEVNMRFEGYIKSKWFKRSWEQLPSGELRYRNSGMNSSNLDDPRYFLAWLTSLPNLHVSLVKPMTNRPRELVFPTKPLLDSMKQDAICQP